jgi:hypothetical protein
MRDFQWKEFFIALGLMLLFFIPTIAFYYWARTKYEEPVTMCIAEYAQVKTNDPDFHERIVNGKCTRCEWTK